jgi:DNA-binding transcriptional LysR family regulator
MDRLRALRYFVRLANTLSFSETADHFRVPSSSVSRRIKDLESELGATLFERTTRSVRLTDLGKLYLGEVTEALQSIEMADELVGAQSRAPTGMLRITAMPGYGERFVLPALDRLRHRYADIAFDVSLTDQVISLSGNEVDIAIRAASTLPDQVVARRLGDHAFGLVASPDYIAQHGYPKTSAELKNHQVFMYRAPHGILDWLALRDGVWTAIELNPKFVSNHGRSLLDGAIAGRGIAFLPSWAVAEDIETGRLMLLELEDGALSVSGNAKMGMYLLYHPPKFRLQKIRVAVDFLVAELRDGASAT